MIKTLTALLFTLLVNHSAKCETFTFGVFPFEPWAKETQGEIHGIIPDIANAIEKESGINFSIQIKPYARVISELETGTIDLAVLSRYLSNDRFSDHLSTVFEQNVVLKTKKGITIESLNDLDENSSIVTIGTLRGTKLYPPLFSNNSKLVRYQVQGFEQGLRMLDLNRIDAFLTIDKTSLYYSKKLGLHEKFETPAFFLRKLEASLQASKVSMGKKQQVYKQLESAIVKLRSKHTFRKIISSYMTKPQWN